MRGSPARLDSFAPDDPGRSREKNPPGPNLWPDSPEFRETTLLPVRPARPVAGRIERPMQDSYEVILVDLPSTAVIQLVPSSVDMSILNVYDVGDVSVMVTRVYMVSEPIFDSVFQCQVVSSRFPMAENAGMSFDDIDLFEVNEAFAAVVLKFLKDTGVNWDKVNVNGGAMALGHPIGATGGMLIGTLLDEMERRDLQTGLVTMCTGGGMGTATIIERV